MALRVVTLVALLATSSIILSYNGVYGGRTTLTMEEEDVELERQLKRMNKPAVKSIKTDNGETYDCVDFYKQPAFDNPLLKNHIPEMSSSVQRETPKEVFSGAEQPDLRLDGGGCPLGTVPIRRTTKEDLIRWKSYSKPSGNFHQFLNMAPGYKADDSQRTGCFNAICNGFIQVNREVPIGVAFPKTSTYGGEILDLATYLFQDHNSGNWWVSAGLNITNIGYWPRELFNSIKESAPVVGWRAEVYAPQGEKTPPMGTGRYRYRFPYDRYPDYKTTAYFRAVRVNGEDNIGRGPNDKSLQLVRDGKNCYVVHDFPYIDDHYRHTFFYGGSGC
ncbi:uncharacterized protein LOC122666001 [Telopea speciosissima]|uniref:uncharacterized protein LOC122666001 n=1 Tax=Telopea speciosissima TaxID=54955 RepID=UPI001CC4DF14|nr:uncharacterized protein LOC122666001 [Telopea speciosissima]